MPYLKIITIQQVKIMKH